MSRVETRPYDRTSLIGADASDRVVTEWPQGYMERGGQKRDEKPLSPKPGRRSEGSITETSTD
jgi:hypothetical protein